MGAVCVQAGSVEETWIQSRPWQEQWVWFARSGCCPLSQSMEHSFIGWMRYHHWEVSHAAQRNTFSGRHQTVLADGGHLRGLLPVSGVFLPSYLSIPNYRWDQHSCDKGLCIQAQAIFMPVRASILYQALDWEGVPKPTRPSLHQHLTSWHVSCVITNLWTFRDAGLSPTSTHPCLSFWTCWGPAP